MTSWRCGERTFCALVPGTVEGGVAQSRAAVEEASSLAPVFECGPQGPRNQPPAPADWPWGSVQCQSR